MDYNAILVAAFIGGASVGGAFALAALINKIMPERFHNAIKMGAVIASVAIMTAANNLYDKTNTENEIENILSENKLLQAVQAGFPEEYADFVTKIMDAKTEEEGRQLGLQLTSGIRRRNADNLLAAPRAALHEMWLVDRALTKLVQEEQGWKTCNAYLEKGGAIIASLEQEYSDRIEKYGLLLIEAISQSEGKDQIRGAATAEDWAAFVDYWRSEGGSEEFIQLFVTPDFEKAETCGAYVSFFNTLARFEGEGADRLLTEVTILKAKN